jgi:hypothetical protein
MEVLKDSEVDDHDFFKDIAPEFVCRDWKE